MTSAPATGDATVSTYPLPPLVYFKRFDPKDEDFVPVPPRPPATGDTYSMFGSTYTTEDRLPSLEEAGREVLYDPEKRRTDEIKRLNAELIKLFLSLIDSVCESAKPEQIQAKVDSIEGVLVNMHHLINTFRQDHARIEVFNMIYRQTELREEATKRLRKGYKQAVKLINTAKELLESTQLRPQVESDIDNLIEEAGKSEAREEEPEKSARYVDIHEDVIQQMKLLSAK